MIFSDLTETIAGVPCKNVHIVSSLCNQHDFGLKDLDLSTRLAQFLPFCMYDQTVIKLDNSLMLELLSSMVISSLAEFAAVQKMHAASQCNWCKILT